MAATAGAATTAILLVAVCLAAFTVVVVVGFPAEHEGGHTVDVE